MSVEITLATPQETAKLAKRIAPYLKAGDLIALHGDLGAGKTTFARGLICALTGAEIDVPSPTYTLVQTYDGPSFPIYHFDLYRLNAPAELDELGWDDTFSGLALVEWPLHAGARLPDWRLDLTLEHLMQDVGEGRRAVLEPRGEDWHKRLHGFAR